MKKIVFLVLVFLLAALTIDSLTVRTAKSSYTQVESPYSRDTILVLIEEELYPEIERGLIIFEQDLNNEGYQVIEKTVSSQLSPPEIKNVIESCYLENNITGAILIGNIKAAYCEFHTGSYSEIWISLDACDMYYMDLNGQWENVINPDFCEDAPPHVVECHKYPSCDTFRNEYIVSFDEEKEWDYSAVENKDQYKAEIWVSRIMAHNLDISGKNESHIINDFFGWDHRFRTGQRSVSDKAYLLNAIDADFQNMNFSKIFGTIETKEYVTKKEYLSCLEDSNGSKLMYLLAHSGPQVHALNDTYVTTDDLENKNKTSVFYILNACSSCRWDHYTSSSADPNYLGGLYVFDTSPDRRNYGLGAIGFTGVGGFNFLEYFTDYLNDQPDSNYGEAFKYWFNLNLMNIFYPWNYVFLGDPTIGPMTPQLPVHNIDSAKNFSTIQEAINDNETLNGHTILVDEGTYYEHVVVNKSVTLRGQNKSTTIIDGNRKGIPVRITSNNVHITDFTITNGIGSTYYPKGGLELASVQGCNISNNNILNNEWNGIWITLSSNNTISGNNVTASDWTGIHLQHSSNNTIEDNAVESNFIGIWLDNSSDNILRDNSMDNNTINFGVAGMNLSGFMNDIDISNTVNGKPIHYWIDRHDSTVPSNAGCVILVNCTNITVQNLNLNSGVGVLLAYTTNSVVTRNNIINNYCGIGLGYSSNISISGNNVTNNWDGIGLGYSSSNKIYGNNVIGNNYLGISLSDSSNNKIYCNNIEANNEYGISLSDSSNNKIYGNKIKNSEDGIWLLRSSNNIFYHNNFLNNTRHARALETDDKNFWDDGYPSGGNYWSDYNGTDAYYGENSTGPPPDGIGDTSYTIDAKNTDRYPLMGMFSDFNATSEYRVQTICNSSISDFQFNGTAICFNVTGEDASTGFCRICIPRALINETYQVFVNGTEAQYNLLPCSNTTHSYLYFTYNHSTEEVIIIPEFPTWTSILLILIVLTAAITIYKRRLLTHACMHRLFHH